MTPLKTIRKATVDGAIKLARLPADTVLRAAPESVASSAGLALDRADAAVRGAAGAALRDEQLRGEAKRLREAVAERRHALGLHERARERTEAGEKQAEKARAEAEKRRELADQQAERKRERARQRGEQEQAETKKAEAQHQQAAQKRAAKQQDKVEEQAQAGRIDALRGQGRRARGARARANRDRRGSAAQGCCRGPRSASEQALRPPGLP